MKKIILISLLFLSILIQDCVIPENQADRPENKEIVYLAGYYEKDTKRIPCYWKGNERTDLKVPDNCSLGMVNSIFIYNNTVYTAGFYYYEKKNIACYWKGSERTDLTVPADCGFSEASAIFVYNGIVYTSGYYDLNLGFYEIQKRACYWEETNRSDLEIQANDYSPSATSIFVDDGIVYTAGHYSYYSGRVEEIIVRPCYWTGNKRTDLQVPANSNVNLNISLVSSIWVDNGIIYTGGVYFFGTKYNACYWTGTVKTDLSVPAECNNGSGVRSIFYHDGILYASGNYGNEGIYGACYWKGLMRTDLPVPNGVSGEANSIFVHNGIIYTAGNYYDSVSITNTACYWIGTKRIDLLIPEGSSYSKVQSLFVVAESRNKPK